MKARRKHPESGNAMIEFILVGIGLLFMLFSIFEICRGVWIYTTLAHAIKAGTRYAVVHGKSCTVTPNNCGSATTTTINGTVVNVLSVAAVAQEIQRNSRALDFNKLTITAMTVGPVGGTPTHSVTGTSCPGASTGVCLSTLLNNTNTCFPLNATTPTCSPSISGSPGDQVIISATYPFNTFISMFWPGGGVIRPFGRFDLPATGQQKVEF